VYLVFLQVILLHNKISFSASKTLSRQILKIPEDKIVPYNAQATLHFYDAFWALFLPVTVAGKNMSCKRKTFRMKLLFLETNIQL